MDPDIVVAVYRSQERLLEARLEHRRTRLARAAQVRPERRRQVHVRRAGVSRR
ncbi:hypothetical protein [Cellulomonas alba]|uniref:Uncharacterized protein n=1 Tax=Cellulomonas alba TaxID=3053467 RepID=A0ABT7SHS8_9CELL|nr:hypothetical protein [Cellulomonas alba]MDM7855740.1 hypothetical protein [Cellulomonas alba]